MQFMLRIAYESASAISPSTKSRRRGRLSTSVTSTPRAANIDAYSTPMTPAPTTIIVRGRSLRPRMPSESRIVSPSTATPGGAAGRVPVAITILSASTSVVALRLVTVSV